MSMVSQQRFTKSLTISTSPHASSGVAVNDIMRNVVYALLPVCGFSVYAFGTAALLTILVATATCVLTEHLMCRINATKTTVGDWSAVITGILFALTLPPGLPLWMVAFGAFICISMGKYLFGGLGYNAFNPALVGRAFLQAAFPSAMTTWSPVLTAERFSTIPPSLFTFPFTAPDYSLNYDGLTSATPLAMMKFEQQVTENADLLLGFTSGSLGETSAVAILLGGLWLVARNMMNWRIPVSILATVVVFGFIFHQVDAARYPEPMFMLLSGGLMLGAVFMATDMVASPMTSNGVVIYGMVIGVLIMVIRYWGGLPEGVMYAILLANALSPHIDAMTQPKVFGEQVSNKDKQRHLKLERIPIKDVSNESS